jgi:hypothetical protein
MRQGPAPTPWSSSGAGQRRPGSDRTSPLSPYVTTKSDIDAFVGISGRIAPLSGHDDACGRKNGAKKGHNHGSGQADAPALAAWSRAARSGPPRASQASQTHQVSPRGPSWLPSRSDDTVRVGASGRRGVGAPGRRRVGRRTPGAGCRGWATRAQALALADGSGERAVPESAGSVRYDRIVAFDLGGAPDPAGALKLDRGPHPPWYCETLPVKCRS